MISADPFVLCFYNRRGGARLRSASEALWGHMRFILDWAIKHLTRQYETLDTLPAEQSAKGLTPAMELRSAGSQARS